MLNKRKGMMQTPRNKLHNALLTLNFLNDNENGTGVSERQWITEKASELNQSVYFKDVLTSEWKPVIVLCSGRGFSPCFHRRRKAMHIIKINQNVI